MKRRVLLVVVCLLGVAGLATVPGAQGGAPKKARVAAVDYEFEAAEVKIRKGGKVTWKFEEGRHNVKGKGWKSPTKTKGTYSRKFKKVGTFKYRCTLHQPDMDGVVRVVK